MKHVMKFNEMFAEEDIIEKKTIAFLKYLEKSNLTPSWLIQWNNVSGFTRKQKGGKVSRLFVF